MENRRKNRSNYMMLDFINSAKEKGYMLSDLFWQVMLVLALIALFFVASERLEASEASLQVFQSSQVSSGDYQANGNGVKFSYMFDKAYLFASKEKLDVGNAGYAFNLNLDGIGAGFKHQSGKYMRVFADIGYYFTSTSNVEREGVAYGLRRTYGGDWYFDDVDVTSDDFIGATLGVELIYPFAKNWTVGGVLSYSARRIGIQVKGFDDDWAHDDNIQDVGSKDFSSLNLGVSVSHYF